jgi:mono/diheme cytochrome c family protein
LRTQDLDFWIPISLKRLPGKADLSRCLKNLFRRVQFVIEFGKENPGMIRFRWIVLIFLATFPLTTQAQQSGPEKSLNSEQKLGQRIFQQRCGICHEPARPGFQTYGPVLYQNLVNGSEDAIKAMIRDGSTKMPGFKLGLQPSEIDAIVEYLKTVPRPAKNQDAPAGSIGPLD